MYNVVFDLLYLSLLDEPIRPKPEFKRGTSRTDLKRQLSKQSSVISVAEEEATEKTQLIGEEKVETGNVRKME